MFIVNIVESKNSVMGIHIKIRALGLFFLLLFSGTIFSQIVTPEDAQIAAFHFIKQMNPEIKSQNNIQLSYTSKTQSGQPAWYVFTTGANGYVILSADELAYPVMAYSYNSQFFNDEKLFPPAFVFWMEQRTLEIEEIRQLSIPADLETTQLWSDLKAGTFQSSQEKTRSVEPLLNSAWNQDCRYNEQCPVDAAGPCGRVYAGCVATAMGQIMYYWRFPQTGNGTNSYNASPYGTQYVNFGATTYKWDEMKGSINTSHPELAKFLYHAGVSVNMGYSPTGSGANSESVPAAMKNKFRYQSANYRSKTFYTTTNWNNMLIDNLDNKYPIYYSGSGSQGGHAFNIDGYQGTDHFHFDWGWSGYYNGYYYLSNLNPGTNTFNNWQAAVMDIYPPSATYPQYCSGQKTLTAMSGSFDDGSGPVANYQANTNCSWLISPSVPVDWIRLNFVYLDTETSNDIVTVYDGETTAAPVLGTYSGSTLPTMLQSTGQHMLVTFTSNSSVQNNGFLVEYSTNPSKFCSGTVSLTDPSGTIEDGSGDYQYANSSNCRWFIEPLNAVKIHITFYEFNTEPTNDRVRITNLDNGTLVSEFSGNQIPAPFEVNASRVQIQFITNTSVQGEGWALTYSITTDIEETNMNSFSVFPNPATDIINIEFSGFEDGGSVSIFDMSGRKIIHQILEAESKTHSINTTFLSSGLYIIELQGVGEMKRTKISIQ
jgi:hypothetical protein